MNLLLNSMCQNKDMQIGTCTEIYCFNNLEHNQSLPFFLLNEYLGKERDFPDSTLNYVLYSMFSSTLTGLWKIACNLERENKTGRNMEGTGRQEGSRGESVATKLEVGFQGLSDVHCLGQRWELRSTDISRPWPSLTLCHMPPCMLTWPQTGVWLNFQGMQF